MHIDRARLDMDVGPPDRVEQFLARKHPARMLHEEFQQAELGRAEMDRARIAADAVRGQVHGDVVEVQHAFDGTALERRSRARIRASSASMLNGLVM